MDINTNITKKSWNPPKHLAKDYLHNYPPGTRKQLANFMKEKGLKSALDIGCGNAQLYPILKKEVPSLEYTGIDGSKSLIDAAKEVVGNDGTLVLEDMYKYMQNNTHQYDVSVLSHILECVESPEMLVDLASKSSKYLAILWFDTPKYQYDAVIVAESAHPGEGFRPYIRRKMGAGFWKYIVTHYGLEGVYRVGDGPNNILDIYERKK